MDYADSFYRFPYVHISLSNRKRAYEQAGLSRYIFAHAIRFCLQEATGVWKIILDILIIGIVYCKTADFFFKHVFTIYVVHFHDLRNKCMLVYVQECACVCTRACVPACMRVCLCSFTRCFFVLICFQSMQRLCKFKYIIKQCK